MDNELLSKMQNLRQDSGFKYFCSIVEAWERATLGEVLAKKEAEKEKGEYSAYARVLKLVDAIIKDLNEGSNPINLDPYALDENPGSNPPAR